MTTLQYNPPASRAPRPPERGKISGQNRRPRGGVRSAIRLSLILAAALSAFSCSDRKQSRKPAAGASSATSALQAPLKPSRVVGLGRIEPEQKILTLSGEVQGLIVKINAQPGDRVVKGAAIVELTRAVEEAKVEQAETKARARFSDIEAAKAALAATRVRAENANISFQRSKILLEQDSEAKAAYDNVKAEHDALAEDLKRFESGVKSAENLLEQDRAELKLARAELDRRFVRAPVDGRILSLDVAVGSLVAPGGVFGKFAPDGPLTAWCEIDELFAADVKEGQKAAVRMQGMTEELGRGTVVFAGPYLRKKSLFSDEVGDLEDRRVREVRIRLEPGAPLLIGSRVECVIVTDK